MRKDQAGNTSEKGRHAATAIRGKGADGGVEKRKGSRIVKKGVMSSGSRFVGSRKEKKAKPLPARLERGEQVEKDATCPREESKAGEWKEGRNQKYRGMRAQMGDYISRCPTVLGLGLHSLD